MTPKPPPCDLAALRQIEKAAPHWLTPADRHALRLHRDAPAVSHSVPVIVLAVGLALVILPFLFGAMQ